MKQRRPRSRSFWDRNYTIYIPVPVQVRKVLLSLIRPLHANVHCSRITLEYGVSNQHPLPEGPIEIAVMGHYANDKVQALLCQVSGNYKRPDGRPYFLTLSTADGISSAAGGDFSLAEVEPLDSGEALVFDGVPALALRQQVRPKERKPVLTKAA